MVIASKKLEKLYTQAVNGVLLLSSICSVWHVLGNAAVLLWESIMSTEIHCLMRWFDTRWLSVEWATCASFPAQTLF